MAMFYPKGLKYQDHPDIFDDKSHSIIGIFSSMSPCQKNLDLKQSNLCTKFWHLEEIYHIQYHITKYRVYENQSSTHKEECSNPATQPLYEVLLNESVSHWLYKYLINSSCPQPNNSTYLVVASWDSPKKNNSLS